MPDTHETDLYRAKMLRLDKIIHTLDNELLQYIVYRSGQEIEMRSEQYLQDEFDKIRVKICKNTTNA